MTEPADEIPETTPGQAAYLLARAELQSAKSRNEGREPEEKSR